jgi:hypothetical protein
VVQTAEEGWKFVDEQARPTARIMRKVKREKKTIHVGDQCPSF